MSLLANQPSSIAKVLDTSFKLYATSFKKVIGYGLIISVIYLLMNVASNQLVLMSTNPEQFSDNSQTAMVVGVISILGILAVYILYAAIIYRFDNLVHGREDSFSGVLWQASKKTHTLFYGLILYMLGIMGGMLLLVIPGLIFWLSLAFYIYFIVIDDSPAYRSLKASHKLVWGNWWRTVAVFIVPMFIMVIMYALMAILVVYFDDVKIIPTLSVADVFLNLSIGIIMPFFYAVGYVQYQDLKLRKSGSDLDARMT